MIGSLAIFHRMFLLMLLFVSAGDACAEGAKALRQPKIGVTFEIDGAGQLISLNTIVEANHILLPELQQKFRNYRFKPRNHQGIPVPATLQAIVPLQVSETQDGKLKIEFKDPEFQAVRTGGEPIDYLSIVDLISERGAVFDVTVMIRPDGTVAEAIVKTRGLRVQPEAVAAVKKIASTWTYAVDKVDGQPVAMVAKVQVKIGGSDYMFMPSIGRPMSNP